MLKSTNNDYVYRSDKAEKVVGHATSCQSLMSHGQLAFIHSNNQLKVL